MMKTIILILAGAGLLTVIISAFLDYATDKQAEVCRAKGGDPVSFYGPRVICFEKGVVKA